MKREGRDRGGRERERERKEKRKKKKSPSFLLTPFLSSFLSRILKPRNPIRFYLFVNVGSLLAVTVVVWIQDAVSWSVGFAVPAAAMLCAIVVFVAGAGKYKHVTPAESPMARVVKVLAAAARNARRQRKEAKRADAAERATLRRRGNGNAAAGAAAAAAAAAAASPPPSSSLRSPLLQDASYRSGGGGSLRGGNAFSPGFGLGGGGGGSGSGYDGPVNLPPGTPILSSSAPSPAPPSAAAAARLPRPSSYQWLSFAETGHDGGNGSGSGNDDGRLLPLGASSSASGAASGDGGGGGSGGLAGFTRRQVDEVRMVVRMMPVFWTTAFYWAIYAQMGSFFVEQGQFMDRRLFLSAAAAPSTSASTGARGPGSRPPPGRPPFEVPAASLALFNTVAIIALVPLYDRGLLPLLRACGRRGPTLLQRIGWGLGFCALAMAAAAGVEQARLAKVAAGEVVGGGGGGGGGGRWGGGGAGSEVAALSVFWQVPQYLLVGASEVLASIGQLEFFYDQAPDVMRSCSMALQLLSVAVGSYLSGALVAAVGAGTAWLGWGEGGGGEIFFFFRGGVFFFLSFSLLSLCLSHLQKLGGKKKKKKNRLAPRGPQRGEARPLLLVDGSALRRQHAALPGRRLALPVQGRAPREEEGADARPRGGRGGRLDGRGARRGAAGGAAAAGGVARAPDRRARHRRRRGAPRPLWRRELPGGLGVREVRDLRPPVAGAARAVQVERRRRRRVVVFRGVVVLRRFILSVPPPCFIKTNPSPPLLCG